MKLFFKLSLLGSLTFGADVEFYPDKGTLISGSQEKVAFVQDKNSVKVSFSLNLPKVENIWGSNTGNCGSRFNKIGSVGKLAQQFFVRKLEAEFAGPKGVQTQLSRARLRKSTDRGKSNPTSDLRLASTESTNLNTNANLTTSAPEVMSSTPRGEGEVTDSADQGQSTIKTPYDAISNVMAKMPKNNVLDIFENDFSFSCTTISQNGRLYRTIGWTSQSPIYEVKFNISGQFSEVDLTKPYNLILNVKFQADNTLAREAQACVLTQNINPVTFECKNHKSRTDLEYLLSFGFDSSEMCENSTFTGLEFEFFLRRTRRQFGEFAIPVISGIIGGISAYELGSHTDQNDVQVSHEVKQVQKADFSNDQKLTAEIQAVENQSLKMSKNFNALFKTYTNRLCIIESFSAEQILTETLHSIYEDFLNELQYLILSSSINLKGNKIFEDIKGICKKVNQGINDIENFCDEYYKLKNYEILQIELPTSISKDPLVKIYVGAEIPKFISRKSEVRFISSVPVPKGLNGNEYKYSYLIFPRAFARLEKPIGSYYNLPLDFCTKHNQVHFCPVESLNMIFRPETLCVNSIYDSDIKCEEHFFTSPFDCFFESINDQILLLSNQGKAKLESFQVLKMNHNYGWDNVGGNKLDPVTVLHNITSKMSVSCEKTNFVLQQEPNSFDFEINFSPENFSVITEIEKVFETSTEPPKFSTFEPISITNLTTPNINFVEKSKNWLENLGAYKWVVVTVLALICTFVGSTILVSLWDIFKTLLIKCCAKTVNLQSFEMRPFLTQSPRRRSGRDLAATV